MNKLLILLSVFFLASCSSTKELKQENTDLTAQSTSLQSKNDLLMAENTNLNKSIELLKGNLKNCNKELRNVKTFYNAYKERLNKMKSELLAAFPNNLNEGNFSIKEEDGRLIISIPNSILYARGSADFSQDAEMVIQKLSKVFKNNQGLQILVEGHTDDTPLIRGSRFKDNWDLSVARAVNIVRRFELYGVNPQRLTAAGRGYFAPVNKLDTEEARAMNRRTEIIIRPRIAELLKTMNEIG